LDQYFWSICLIVGLVFNRVELLHLNILSNYEG